MTDEKQEKSEVYVFNDVELDAGQRELRVAGKAVLMQPKAFELLLYLVRHRQRAVDKDELQDHIWPRSIVTETALTRCVMKARRAVGDDADTQSVIKTVHGHGYRFIAAVDERTSSPDTALPLARPKRRFQVPLWGSAIVIVAAIAVVWWRLSPPVFAGEMRLAVLPVVNATGDADLDWTRTGLMAMMNRLFEDNGIRVVGDRSVSGLAGDQSITDLLAPSGEFQSALKKTAAHTHTLASTLEADDNGYRLTYMLVADGERLERRVDTDQEPTQLVSRAVRTITTLVTEGAPETFRTNIVEGDDFINAAYARGMSLQLEGNYVEAQRMFRVIMEQEPSLFWPRYEYALSTRNLREYDTAEQIMVELRNHAAANGEKEHLAAVNNSLGILLMDRRRQDEAREAFETTIRLANEVGKPKYAASAHQNLGLLDKDAGDLAGAIDHMQQAVTIYQSLDIESLPGILLNNLSGVHIQLGELEQAEAYSLESVDSFRLTGMRLFESYALSRLASIYRRKGLLDDAESMARHAMSVREELGDERGTAASLITLSNIAAERGDLTRSLQYAQRGEEIGAEIDDPDIVIASLLRVAKARLLLGEPREAVSHYTAAEAVARSINNAPQVFSARFGLAKGWIAIGDHDGALRIADELMQEARDQGHRRNETAGMNLYAEVYMERGQWTQAIESLQGVLAIAEEIGNPSLTAGANAGLGQSYLELGDTDTARPFIETVAVERPLDSDVLKLRARLASIDSELDEAVAFMSEARLNAGEMWTDEDEATLARYRAAAEAGAAEEN
ncbi:MAG: tetratricopeptide repeat protein [Pseudomonadota bacterium]